MHQNVLDLSSDSQQPMYPWHTGHLQDISLSILQTLGKHHLLVRLSNHLRVILFAFFPVF